MATYLYGVSKIEFGDLASDGGPATVFETLPFSGEGTVSFGEEDPKRTEQYAEEVDDPVFVIVKRGKRTFKTTILDVSSAVLKKLLGGSVSTGAAPKTWSSGSTITILNKTIRITTRNGSVITINNGQCYGKFTGDLNKEKVFGIEFNIDVLQPTKTGVSPLDVTDPA